MPTLTEPDQAQLSFIPEHVSGRDAWRELRQLRLDPLTQFFSLSERFGDVFGARVGSQRFLLVSHPELVRQILHPADPNQMHKGRAVRRSQRVLGNGLLTSEGEFHLRQRRMAQPAFQPRRIAVYDAAMVRHCERVSSGLVDGAEVEMETVMNSLTLRIAGETMFGVDLAGDEARIGKALTETLSQFTLGLHPFAPLFERIAFLPVVRRFDKAVDVLHTVVQEIVMDRQSRTAEQLATDTDLLSILLQARDGGPEGDGEGMSDEQLRDEALTLLLAGHETTANALAWTWYALASNPQIRNRVEAEVDAAIENGGGVLSATSMEQLPYLKSVFEESLRMYPPGPAVSRRTLVDMELTIPPDARICDAEGREVAASEVGTVAVPAGTEIIAPLWAMHRDERWFDHPDVFDPDRMVGERRSALPRYAWMPFGGGRRVCIGMQFALMEGVLVTAALARSWRFDMPEGATPPTPEAQFTVRPSGGLRMVVRKRETADLPK